MNPIRSIAARILRLGPAERVGIGLASLVVAGVLVLDFAFDIFPDEIDMVRRDRARISEYLAMHSANLLSSNDKITLANTMRELVSKDERMLSIAVRREDGSLLVQTGDHRNIWVEPDHAGSDLRNVRVPLILAGNRHWGDVEISFKPAGPASLWEWLTQPKALLILALGVGGFILFSLYLRRVFEYLDPQAVIPDRVRVAFDAFSEGVLVIDTAGRVILANSVIRQWLDKDGRSLHGRPVRRIPALNAALPARTADHPWMRAMAQGITIRGEYIEIACPNGELVKTMINCSPIRHNDGAVRGCIVTFDNVSDIESVNRRLVETLDDLEASRDEIEARNRDLHRMAMHDSLTGCLNRRAFFDSLTPIFEAARHAGRQLCCVMIDIDNFKSFNDRFGHAVGDDVLKAVSQILAGGVRGDDLLCRYGGEEFCIVMPDVGIDEAAEVAERLRRTIETQAGKSVRRIEGASITSSFGIAEIRHQKQTLTELIKDADDALYAAKDAGRNRIKLMDDATELMEPVPG